MDSVSAPAVLMQDKPFRIMDLPAELRLRVYECALAGPVCVDHKYMRKYIRPHQCESMCDFRFPPLLQTSRKVRFEAENLWYSIARFDLQLMSTLRALRAFVGNKKANKIKCSRITGIWYPGYNLSVDYRELRARGYIGALEGVFKDPGGRRVITCISPDTAYSYLEEL